MKVDEITEHHMHSEFFQITEEAAQARMDAQLPEQFFVEHSDFIIKNNKDCRNLEVVSEEVIAKIKEYYIRRYQVPS